MFIWFPLSRNFTRVNRVEAMYGRCGSTPVSTVLRKSVRFFIHKYILIKIKLSKVKSGQYPVWMTQKPRKGDFGELKSKKFPKGEHAPDPLPPFPPPLEACTFGALLGNRSVSILDPRLYGRPCVNVTIERGSTLFTRVKFICVRTQKLLDSGNPPLVNAC